MAMPSTLPASELTVVRIVDDQVAVREAVADLLASVGLASRSYPSVADFLRDDDTAAAGCVLLDVRMPGMSGFDLIALPVMRERQLPVIFVTGHGDIAMAVRAMKAGAVDFLTKPFDDQALIDAVNVANRIDLHRRRQAAPLASARERLASLTEGERAVLDLTVRGLRNKQIAASLALSEITVKVRRARMMDKLAATSITDLVRLYDTVHAKHRQSDDHGPISGGN